MRAQVKTLLVVVLVLSLVETPVFASPSRSLGVITQAQRARVSSGDAVSGATVFDGDVLVTDLAGTLRARMGESQLYLPANSLVAVRQVTGGVNATLQRGTIVFSTSSPQAFELLASDARIRAKSAKPTYAQVTLVGPYELLVTCQRGELEVTIGEEVHAVPENTSYDVTIEPPAQGPQGGPPVATGRSKWRIVAVILILAGTGVGIWRALISPSHP